MSIATSIDEVISDLRAAGSHGFRARLVAERSGATEQQVRDRLDELILAGEIRAEYDVLCIDGDDDCYGDTITRAHGIEEVPFGEEIRCEQCGLTTYVDDQALWLVFRPV